MADATVPPFELRGVAYYYMQVANHVAARIRAGGLKPEARLLGEREMAEEYGVAIGTVRRAIVELRERGYVVTMAAKGTYVTHPEDWPPQDDE